jgi:uncharacterized membrane protein YedE/YeeE
MKQGRFIIAGIIFGIIMSKSEAFSWYRIQEMFRFQSFHMFGIIGVAAVLGVVGLFLIRKFRLQDFSGREIILSNKVGGFSRYLFGGIIFGLGWALAGACPGPMFVTLGAGYLPMAIVILSAIMGTFAFGLIKRS